MQTYPAIRARSSGFSKFPGKRLPIFLSATARAAPQRCNSGHGGGGDVILFMSVGTGHGHSGDAFLGRLLRRIRGVAAS